MSSNESALISSWLEKNDPYRCRTRRARGLPPKSSLFGGNRVFFSRMAVSSSVDAGMLRMGTTNKKYGKSV